MRDPAPCVVGAVALALAAAAAAHAEPSLTAESDTPRTTDPDPDAALPFVLHTRHVEPGATGAMIGGYDASSNTPIVATELEATIVDRVALRAGLTSDALVSHLHPDLGITVDVLRGRLDLAVGADYQSTGFNMVPAIVPRVTAATTLGATRLAAQLAYGAGLQQGERYGDAQLTILRPVARRIAAGLGTRLRLDLQSDPVEPVGERVWDVEAGPTATVALGRVALGAMTGLSAWQEHVGAPRTGVIAELGVASTF